MYRWFIIADGAEVTLYVGQAGKSNRGVADPSTLKRGILEAQRGSLTSSKARRKLDTDFVLGTALRYCRDLGHDCYWEHIADDPFDESRLCRKLRPTLQGIRPVINTRFKPRKPRGGRWDSADLELADRLVREQLARHLKLAP